MATYSMRAPDGNTYDIEGPEGATDEQVRAEIIRQHPRLSMKGEKLKKPTQYPDSEDHVSRRMKQEEDAKARAQTPEGPLAGLTEAVLNMGSSMVAKPLGDVAGLGAWVGRLSGIDSLPDPQTVKEKVIEGGTYMPRSEQGKGLAEYNPVALIGKAVGYGAEKAGDLFRNKAEGQDTVGNTVGNAVEEGVNQVAGFIGPKKGATVRQNLPVKEAILKNRETYEGGKNEIRDRAQEAGYVTPAEWGWQAGLTGLSGKARTHEVISYGNEVNATKRIGKEIGLPENVPITAEALERAAEVQHQRYRDLESAAGPRIEVTPEFAHVMMETSAKLAHDASKGGEYANAKQLIDHYTNEIVLRHTNADATPNLQATINKTLAEQPEVPPKVQAEAEGTARSPYSLDQLSNMLEQAAGEQPHAHTATGPWWPQIPEFPGKTTGSAPAPFSPRSVPVIPELNTSWVMSQISELRRDAKGDYRKGDNLMGETRMALAKRFEDMIEKAIGDNAGKAQLDDFKDARKTLAKIHLMEKVTNDQTGTVNLGKLGSISDTAAFKGILDGEVKTAADFAKTFGEASKHGTSGQVVGQLSKLDALWGIGGLAIGHGYAGAAKIASGLIGPAMGKYGKLQNRTPSYELSGLSRSTPALLETLGPLVTSEAQDQDNNNVSLRKLMGR